MNILVTGGSGFIGSNFIKYLLESDFGEVINFDNLTYAARGRNIEHMGLKSHSAYSFRKGDLCSKVDVERVFEEYKPELVFNFAAESHVDRSIDGSKDFVMSNVLGATNIFDAAKKHKVQRMTQVSTDEVYGSIGEGSFGEDAPLNPSSPYSASKAAADLMALAYHKTHKLPVIITRSANNYGAYQFPEKILPLFITNLIRNKKVPLMWSEENPGLNVRDWLNVQDNCKAIWFATTEGKEGEIYNIPGENEKTNIDVTKMMLKHFAFGEEMIERVEHRKAHDFRYSVKGDKLRELGFEYEHKDFQKELGKTIEWYVQNRNWWGEMVK